MCLKNEHATYTIRKFFDERFLWVDGDIKTKQKWLFHLPFSYLSIFSFIFETHVTSHDHDSFLISQSVQDKIHNHLTRL